MTRLDLHAELVEVLGSRYVYFQPPTSVKMEYPCIVYSVEGSYRVDADNKIYKRKRQYHLTYITRDPDDTTPERIEEMRYCRFKNQLVVERLYHTHFTIYF